MHDDEVKQPCRICGTPGPGISGMCCMSCGFIIQEHPSCPSCSSAMLPYATDRFRCVHCVWTGDQADLDATSVFRKRTGHRLADAPPSTPATLGRRGDDIYVNTAAGSIRLTTDASLKPGEFRLEQPSIVKQLCARCRTEFQFTSSDTNVDAVLAAHQERCFAVGDWVRWTPQPHCQDNWFEGEVIGTTHGRVDWILVNKTDLLAPSSRPIGEGVRVGSKIDPSVCPGAIRRIPRPGQEVATVDNPCDQFDVKYDGVTLLGLLIADENARRETPLHCMPLWYRINDGFTPAQRSAVSAHWSAQLRARIAARQEAERNAVVLEQDAEDIPWRE